MVVTDRFRCMCQWKWQTGCLQTPNPCTFSDFHFWSRAIGFNQRGKTENLVFQHIGLALTLLPWLEPGFHKPHNINAMAMNLFPQSHQEKTRAPKGASMWSSPECQSICTSGEIGVCQCYCDTNMIVICSKLLIMFSLSGIGFVAWNWLS